MTMAGAEERDAEQRAPLLGPDSVTLANTDVYNLIICIRKDIIRHVDAPLTWEQLLASDSNYTIVQPLVEKYASLRNHAMIFCLLVNRVKFIRDSSLLSISLISLSRAALCELLAIRLLRAWSDRTIELSSVLLTPWSLFQGSSAEVMQAARDEGEDDAIDDKSGNALEMAIISKSKRFIKSPSCQKVINAVYSGRVVYQASNVHAIISDNYKQRPISLYNPHKAPVLDHYRLKVPRIRGMLEYVNFVILFALFVVALEGAARDRINWKEGIFIVYAAGFTLDKVAAMQEHGLKVFSSNLWNGFDLAWVAIYLAYMSFRCWGLMRSEEWAYVLGTDMLALGACVVFPRLAFVSLSDNLLILALRSLIIEFSILMMIAAFCFIGFLYALWTLAEKRIHYGTIAWWMLDIWFGLDASGFNEATNFHPIFGPIVIITYACLSNTLILTVLVAILSKTFADISQDAAAESMFRRAVSTFEGVKSDAIFSYQSPFNLVAVVILLPAKYILNDRWMHKLNVMMIRVSNAPILLLISFYERQVFGGATVADRISDVLETVMGVLPKRLRHVALFEGLAGSAPDIDAVFEIEAEVGGAHLRGWDDDDASEVGDGDIDHTTWYPERGLDSLRRHSVSNKGPLISPKPTTEDHSANISQQNQPHQPSGLPPSTSPDGSFIVASPKSIDFPRKRRNSADQNDKVEPSPLARLFVPPPPPPKPQIRFGGVGLKRSSSLGSHEPFARHTRSMSHPASHPPAIPEDVFIDGADEHDDGGTASELIDNGEASGDTVVLLERLDRLEAMMAEMTKAFKESKL